MGNVILLDKGPDRGLMSCTKRSRLQYRMGKEIGTGM